MMQECSFDPVNPLHPHKLQFIDNLRGLAILLVIFHHIGEAFPNANYIRIISPWCKCGVQLFFVMSAFTMCYTGSKLILKPKPIFGFYIKRFFRIAPMYYLAIVAYWFFAYLTTGSTTGSLGDITGYNKTNVLANILFLHGLYPPANNNIVPGGWSIGCEMLFYVLFPFIINLVKVSKGYIILIQIVSWLAVSGLLVVAKLNGHHGLGGGSSFAYYFIASQMPLFMLGILLFMFWESKTFFKTLVVASIAGIAFIVGFNYLGLSSWIWLLLPTVFGTVACVFSKLVSKIKLPAIMAGIGKVSYSMYILHFAFLWIVFQLFNREKIDHSNVIATAAFLFVVVLSFLFSKISYRLIEAPFIKIGKKAANNFLKTDDNRQVASIKIVGTK